MSIFQRNTHLAKKLVFQEKFSQTRKGEYLIQSITQLRRTFPMRRSTTPSKIGFTLIELLVVIAIISILAAILFPVFARARENARRTSCLSNLKQISLGIMQYTQDFDEKVPPCRANNPADFARFLSQRIEPYVKSTQVYICRSDIYNTRFSYGYNYIHLAITPTSTVSLASINSPAETVMLVDKGGNDSTDWVYSPRYFGVSCAAGSCSDPAFPSRATGDVIAHHLDGTNVMWADGHVKWHRISQISGPPGCTGAACDVLWDLN
jgi:prepilin-type N-terminal cleavage/methylation domain-containing protein/prepilin-type processing-associated H-X9-DG protein